MRAVIVKFIVSIGLFVGTGTYKVLTNENLIGKVLLTLFTVGIFYAICTLFHFSIDLTGNYLVAAIVFVIGFALFAYFFVKLEELGGLGTMLMIGVILAPIGWDTFRIIRAVRNATMSDSE